MPDPAPSSAPVPSGLQPDITAFAQAVLDGRRGALARAITLVESRAARHFQSAQALLTALLPHTGGAHRIGITGVPGVGKSTFIEALGSYLTGQGHKVAVLAVDPSSGRSGGSILGDKTRMGRLAVDPNAFIRPSPSAGLLGGVARATRETMLLCEAAGFDIVLVETVGTGQSETEVAQMVDLFLVLMLPGAGDDLQGIKKGILEMADIIAVNKADADKTKADRAARDYRVALSVIAPASHDWDVPVLTCSGLTGQGLQPLWGEVEKHRRIMEKTSAFEARRRDQRVRWMWAMLEGRLIDHLRRHDGVSEALPRIEAAVAAADLPPSLAAEQILALFMADKKVGGDDQTGK
ncbi:MAG: methylmalonyl Co-A mutase-associated GTPase MeaB [Rhodothalassiaceae bacterium]